MEKPNPSRINTGSIRLPIGFRFRPTDEELLLQYLKRKVCSLPFPASVIPEFDVFRTHPLDFPGDPREKRYFFSSRKEEENVGNCKHSNTISVEDASGYWKATGRHKRIISQAGSNQAVGTKRSLAFYQGKRPNGSRTDWIMHQYCLVASSNSPYPNLQNVPQAGDWVVCRIHRKRRKIKNHSCRNREATGRELIKPCIWDFVKEDGTDLTRPPQASSSSSSGSSGITNVSCNDLDQEANSDDIKSSKLF